MKYDEKAKIYENIWKILRKHTMTRHDAGTAALPRRTTHRCHGEAGGTRPPGSPGAESSHGLRCHGMRRRVKARESGRRQAEERLRAREVWGTVELRIFL